MLLKRTKLDYRGDRPCCLMHAPTTYFFLMILCNIVINSSFGNFTFAVIPKSLDNPFFKLSHNGCLDAAIVLGVQCLWIGPAKEDAELQANITLGLIRRGKVDGLAISVGNIDLMSPVIAESVRVGIPVVTFDSDAPDSARSVYVGTDNYFFGGELGKSLNDLVTTGGTYAVVAGSAPNLEQRAKGLQNYLKGLKKWKQLPDSPSDSKGDSLTAIDQMQEFAKQRPTAIVSVLGAPMFVEDKWVDFVNEYNPNRNITLVCGDSLTVQLESLDRGYVDGLVGQLPYEMGYQALEDLYKIKSGVNPEGNVMGTNVLNHLRVPLVLPPLVVNTNLIGNLKYVGYTLFGIVAVTSVTFVIWTWKNRNVKVVKVSQPLFLLLVGLGVLIMASALVPLSQDDSGREVCDTKKCSAICMSVPWLGFLGFTITFTALFVKTWRINRIFRAKVLYGRVKIVAKDVLAPLFALLIANSIVLICWTVLDPLTYIRKPLEGTDGWGRVIATYGSCYSRQVGAFLIPLAVVNIGVMVVANWQAFEARTIQSEFSESKYIAMSIASMMQAAFIGVPTLFVVRTSPSAYYLILSFMLFVICMAVLIVIFVPKIVIYQNYQHVSLCEKRRLPRANIKRSQASSFQGGTTQFVGIYVDGSNRPPEMINPDDLEDECHVEFDDTMFVVDTSHRDFRKWQSTRFVIQETGDSTRESVLPSEPPLFTGESSEREHSEHNEISRDGK